MRKAHGEGAGFRDELRKLGVGGGERGCGFGGVVRELAGATGGARHGMSVVG